MCQSPHPKVLVPGGGAVGRQLGLGEVLRHQRPYIRHQGPFIVQLSHSPSLHRVRTQGEAAFWKPGESRHQDPSTRHLIRLAASATERDGTVASGRPELTPTQLLQDRSPQTEGEAALSPQAWGESWRARGTRLRTLETWAARHRASARSGQRMALPGPGRWRLTVQGRQSDASRDSLRRCVAAVGQEVSRGRQRRSE